jgi:hypothetical protein
MTAMLAMASPDAPVENRERQAVAPSLRAVGEAFR